MMFLVYTGMHAPFRRQRATSFQPMTYYADINAPSYYMAPATDSSSESTTEW